jgi:DNA-binding transcriptional ArsR family regulator
MDDAASPPTSPPTSPTASPTTGAASDATSAGIAGRSLVGEPDHLRLALSPIRRQLLARLREPGSAAELARELGLPRQRVNYHLRALESAGLVGLVAERQRRGCTERVLRTTAEAFVVDPMVMSADQVDTALTGLVDMYAAEHLIDVAAATVRDVARMQASAHAAGKRLLTFTVEADVDIGEPGDVHRLADALADAVRDTVAAFHTRGGRPYRLVVGGHPAPTQTGGSSS